MCAQFDSIKSTRVGGGVDPNKPAKSIYGGGRGQNHISVWKLATIA